MKWVLIAAGTLAALVALMAAAGALVPRDHRATSTVTLQQPPDTVWMVVRDLGAMPQWWPEIKESRRLPDQDGHEAWRQNMGGFDATLVVVEASPPPPGHLVTRMDGGEGASFGGTWTYELVAENGGTRISVTEAGWISNPIFRFLSRVVFGYYATIDGYLKHLGRKFGQEVTPLHSPAP